MKRRIATVSAVTMLLLAGCGDNDVSADDARRIIVNGLINDAALSPEIAACTADRALDEHEPSELVNTEGATTASVNDSVRAIVADCTRELTPTTPPTTTPQPTVPGTEPPDLSGYCAAIYDVSVAFAAASDELDDAGPATVAAWIDETRQRLELAMLEAPTPDREEWPLDLLDVLDRFQEAADQAGYVVSSIAPEDGESLVELSTTDGELREFVEDECGRPLDHADVTALAAELTELGTSATTTPAASSLPGGITEVDHPEARIRLSVPAAWQAEDGGVGPTQFSDTTRYLIRSTDLAAFTDGGFNGTGVGIFAVDGTIDFEALLDGSEPAQSCTLEREEDYDDGVYVGTIQFFENCGGSTPRVIVVGAADIGAQVAVYVELRVGGDDDPAVNTVLDSFYV